MVHKNAEYGQVKDVCVAEFGNGTLAVVNASGKDGYRSLLIKSTEKHEIGESFHTAGTTVDSWIPEIAILFKNKESFDVFYEFVENIRKEFERDIFMKNNNLGEEDMKNDNIPC